MPSTPRWAEAHGPCAVSTSDPSNGIAAAPTSSRLDSLPPSTTSEVLAGKRLPRLPRQEFVASYVAACLQSSGQDESSIAVEVDRWCQLWCSLTEPVRPDEPVPVVRPPLRRPALLLTVAVVLAGVGTGAAATWGWTHRDQRPAAAAAPRPEPPDGCVSPGAADPGGEDVLRLPPAGQSAGSWWVSDANTAE